VNKLEQSKGVFAGFWEHVEELRKRLRVVIVTLIVATSFFAVFPANPQDMFSSSFWVSGLYRPFVSLVLSWLKDLVAPKGVSIINLDVGAPFEIYFAASLVFGLLVSSPIIAYEIYKFVDPALYPNERKSIYPFTLAFTGLFISGALFGLFVLTPWVVYTSIIFSQYVGSTASLSVTNFYYMILTFIAVTGVAFTTPIIFILLVKLRIVKTQWISKNRLWFYFILYIICAIVTPDGSPLVDIALFVPIALLWEAALQIAKRYEKKSQTSSMTIQSKVVNYSSSKTSACEFCGKSIETSEVFCSKCGRAQRLSK